MDQKKRALLVSSIAFVCVLAVVVAIVLVNVNLRREDTPVTSLEKALSVSFPADTAFEWQGLDDGSGEVSLRATIPSDQRAAFEAELNRAANWSDGPMREDVEVFIYDGIYQRVVYEHGIAAVFGIPKPDGAYWFFLDRDAGKADSFLLRDRLNLLFALYDAQEGVLYSYDANR